MTTPSLFDAPLAARSDAIHRADIHADAEWKDVAYAAILKVARMRPEFTADEVWDELADVDASTHEPSALGPVFLRASKAGLIQKTGRMVLSRSPRRHRDLTIWTRRPS